MQGQQDWCKRAVGTSGQMGSDMSACEHFAAVWCPESHADAAVHMVWMQLGHV